MKCPYCNREIYAMTGLQEIQKFQKHLKHCRKAPDADKLYGSDMMGALDIRAKSGQ